jgi:prepilin-type processing-associated H-X9-DG protein
VQLDDHASWSSRPGDLTALLDLGRFLEHHAEPALLLGPDGEQVLLPEEVYRVVVEAVEAMREGKAITLVPRTQRLTTQEAADFPQRQPPHPGRASRLWADGHRKVRGTGGRGRIRHHLAHR